MRTNPEKQFPSNRRPIPHTPVCQTSQKTFSAIGNCSPSSTSTWSGFFQEALADTVDESLPGGDDPRIIEFNEISERLDDFSIEEASLVIKDRELYQLFGKIRQSAVKWALTKNGEMTSDYLYEKLLWEYHPEYFVTRMLQAPPLVTLIAARRYKQRDSHQH